ncbi:MAG TPA: 6-phospho-beta-glucosidase [Streptosporangiaceae bacterium]|nr:6-phospho-beta-glucosidase [Streptosporangiaceae bacterium]
MKLTVLGGGGVRVPAFIRGLLSSRGEAFDEICLFEPDELRRRTTGRLSAELADALGRPGLVRLTAEAEEAFAGADFVFSAIRVGGDAARVVDEEVALRRGIVGQETTGPGGCAMALRTIPVLLGYCDILARCAPGAVLINFTNPVGVITQAISLCTGVRVVGVCDTPSSTLDRLAGFLGADRDKISFSYGGLNHLGWITSFAVDGEERIGTLLDRYEELRRFDHVFAAFDPDQVRRLGAIPTEYVYYFYEPARYVAAVARAGASRGADVLRLNSELLAAIASAFDAGGVDDAWSAYSTLMGVRRDTYMRTDTDGDNQQAQARARRAAAGPAGPDGDRPGGYAGVALQVIDGLTARSPGEVIVNTRNGASLGFLDPDDVVEVPALVHGGGVSPLAVGQLPRSAVGLITQTKQYERELVDAAVTGDAGLAALALAVHPLVPGVTVAREMISEYRERHGPHLAYLR